MELRIGLPDPDEMKPEMFFSQMRVALKAAERMYEEAKKGWTTEELADDDLSNYIRFTYPSNAGDDHEEQTIGLRIVLEK